MNLDVDNSCVFYKFMVFDFHGITVGMGEFLELQKANDKRRN